MELRAQMVIRELMTALLAVEKMEHQDLRNYRIICLPNRRKLDSFEIGKKGRLLLGLLLSLSWRLFQRFVKYSGK